MNTMERWNPRNQTSSSVAENIEKPKMILKNPELFMEKGSRQNNSFKIIPGPVSTKGFENV